jgi:SanA protein
MKKSNMFITAMFLLVVTLTMLYICNKIISDNAKGKLFSDTNTIPFNKVGLLLGTAKYLGSGIANPYYTYRIEATIKLITDSKIKYVIISGDNGRKEYNEPEMMRADLMEAGIDSSNIFLDYAGFRTFDSMVRLKEIFGQESVTVISQQFHNERAIYTASKLGIKAIAFNAKDVSTNEGLRTQIREKFARVKVFIDFLIGTKPKFLGEKIIIPA